MTAAARRLPDGRLHLQHGPIDLIIAAVGPPDAVAAAWARAEARFATILDELVRELPALRAADDRPVRGRVARAMAAAVRPFRPAFVTPMAAVAGAVADEILAHLPGPGIRRAYVNNGGDIALFLAPGESLAIAIAARPGMPDRVTIRHDDPVRGIATSGWRGRSFSFGIADTVTTLAPTAAMADAAATMIANAVDLPDHPAIIRRPASGLQADTDLGDRRVTVSVGPLTETDCLSALEPGRALADETRGAGLIAAAALFLQGHVGLVGPETQDLFRMAVDGAGSGVTPPGQSDVFQSRPASARR